MESKDPVEQTFFDVQNVLYAVTWEFWNKYNGNSSLIGDWDDIFSQACEFFLEAYETWDRNGGCSFDRWVYLKAWRGLEYRFRKPVKDSKKLDYKVDTEFVPSHDGSPERKSLFWEILEGLSDDARTIVNLVLETPEDLKWAMIQDDPKDEPCSYRTHRKGLRQYLLGLGWTRTRIRECFEEITEALK